jgi:hypothetical protein
MKTGFSAQTDSADGASMLMLSKPIHCPRNTIMYIQNQCILLAS